MDAWTAFAMGPGFRLALAFALVGLAWHFLRTLIAIRRGLQRAGDRNLESARLRKDTLGWLLPGRRFRERPVYGVTTLAYHLAIIAVPLFLGGHVALWAGGLLAGWPVLPDSLADGLTYLALLATVLLVIIRVAASNSRALSRPSDFTMLALVVLPFLSGLFVKHPGMIPLPFETSLLIHTLSADLLLVALPFSRAVHCILLPLAQYASQIGWHLVPGVAARLDAARQDRELPH